MAKTSPRLSHKGLLVCLAFVASIAIDPAAGAADNAEAAIREVMRASVVAWDAGDLVAFMDTYEDSPDTLFVGAKGLVRGKAAIAARYASTFGMGAQARPPGKLTFDVLEVQPMGTSYALLIGRYHLQAAEAGATEATGLFSLIFHEHDGHWRIVCDHTS